MRSHFSVFGADFCTVLESVILWLTQAMKKAALFTLLSIVLFSISAAGIGARAEPVHGISMQGDLALAADFKHYPYANPDAPKGGVYKRAITGGFDSLHPFILKGRPAAALRVYVFESLLSRNRSEPFSLYGLIAEKIEVPEDRSQITFYINPKAHFSDGTPITTKDVLFSYETLRDKGRGNHRYYYKKIIRTKVHDSHKITFFLDGKDRELVLILGLMPIISAEFFKTHDFEKTTLKPIVGSGPYVVSQVKPGERVIYKRDPNYWGKDLAVSKGLWNFDEIWFEYFKDTQAAFEAFKKNLVDTRYESDPGRWSSGYDFDAAKSGKVILDTIKVSLPKPTSAFVFNTRRVVFSDKRVREALALVFDFEWANKNLFHGLFKRTQGFFTQSELSSIGRPASQLELDLLKKSGAKLEKRFIDGSFKQPISDGSGRDRNALRKAVKLLSQAGWKFKNHVLTHEKTGRQLAFEIIVLTPDQEKVALHYKRSLRQIGVIMTIRQIDSAQYTQRAREYDFDMMPFTWYNSLSPGNEQSFYWGSSGRKNTGTRNYMGVADPAIDKLIAEIVKAPSAEGFVASVRALDRVLVAGFNIVPLYYLNGQWLARWSHIKYPKKVSNYGYRPETAWYEAP